MPFPPPGDLPHPGIKPGSPTLQADSLPSEPPGKPLAIGEMQIKIAGGLDGKESACNAGDLGSAPGWGRSLGEGNGYPLHYSCLENSMDRVAW